MISFGLLSTGFIMSKSITVLFYSFLLTLSLVLSACASPQGELATRQIQIEGTQFNVEVASNDITRARGLMGREELPEGTGMLFEWDDNAPRAFWMKNTLIPLDILYFRHDEILGEAILVSWTTAHPCQEDPCPSYPSQGAAKYVVELPAGSVERYGWKLGARLTW